jgi:hypothetical protein
MVKYNHCEKCKSIYSTESWIGEVHIYKGFCSSCGEEDQPDNQVQKKSDIDNRVGKHDTEEIERINELSEEIQSSSLEIEKKFLLSLEQKANDVISGKISIDVLIKEIKDELIDKAKERIEETFQSFDAGRIDAQKVVDYSENLLDYLSEYKVYMDSVVIKLRDKPKMKVKTAIDKVFKESMANLPKDVAKDVLLNKRAMLNNVSDMAVQWYNIYSNTKNVLELTNKMVLHPFNEIQKNLGSLPFYASIISK